MTAVVLALLAAGPQPDAGCLGLGADQVLRPTVDSQAFNTQSRAAALADAGLVLLEVDPGETECRQATRGLPVGSVTPNRRYLVAGPFELQTQRTARDVGVAQDAKGVLHFVEFEAVDVVIPVPVRRCQDCQQTPCWQSGQPPCETQPLLGPLPPRPVGKPIRLRWHRQVLRFDDVSLACGAARPCPAVP